MLYSGPAFVWAYRISAILLYVIYRALPGGSDRIVLYYCLMATWTGLGDKTELFLAVLSQLVARQKIPFNLPEIKELSNDEKWDLFGKHVQKHLKFQEDAKPQAFKLFWKTAAKAWRQFRFQLRRDFIRKGLEPFTRHSFIVSEQWKEFMKQAETEQASSASVKFKELRSRNTSEHNMGPAGYTVKLEQWEEEDRQ
jgi:hypothetical protein